jgi:hypothetical protein
MTQTRARDDQSEAEKRSDFSRLALRTHDEGSRETDGLDKAVLLPSVYQQIALNLRPKLSRPLAAYCSV